MEDQAKSIMKEMEETRSSLSEKLEVLEQKVADTVQPVAQAVERVSEAAANIAEGVKDTVDGVKEKVEETMTSVSNAMNLQRRFEEHPWVAVGLAATAGCLFGSMGGPRAAASPPAASAPRPAKAVNGSSRKHGSAAQGPGLFSEEIRRLKALAIGALMGVVRDMAKKSMTGSMGERIAEEIDNLTSQLGARPLASPVLDTPSERSTNGKRDPLESAEARSSSEYDPMTGHRRF